VTVPTPTTPSAAPAPTVLPGAPARELVVAVRPRLGWQRASTGSRAWALLGVLLLGSWPLALLAGTEGGETWVLATAFFAGPPAFYSLARVLRPRLDPSDGRRERHVLASVGSSYGAASALSVWLGTGGTAYVIGTPAFLALCITLPWAVVALLLRVTRTPAPPARR
jgi:hypothetical protein